MVKFYESVEEDSKLLILSLSLSNSASTFLRSAASFSRSAASFSARVFNHSPATGQRHYIHHLVIEILSSMSLNV